MALLVGKPLGAFICNMYGNRDADGLSQFADNDGDGENYRKKIELFV